jgi:hypothetical protein
MDGRPRPDGAIRLGAVLAAAEPQNPLLSRWSVSMGLASDIQACFPRGVLLPDSLRRLCGYIDSRGHPFSGDFQLRPREDEPLALWFGRDAAAASQFAGFGAAGDGSIYAYWLGESRDASRAPVVFLAHGGDGCPVLASSTEEFLALLAVGYRDLGYDFRGEAPPPDEGLRRFRDWLVDELGIQPAASARTVIEQANARHPGFQRWLAQWQAQEPSSA